MKLISKTDYAKFASVYNDLAKYPLISDVGNKLGISERTVRRLAAHVRSMVSCEAEEAVDIIKRPNRNPVSKVSVLTPDDHARNRAVALAEEITSLVTASRYPLINPEAIVVDSHLSRRYSRDGEDYRLVESTPRTWLSDTLRVAPVKDPRGKTYIFTGAQNDAPVHEPFWKNLQAYAKAIGAEIVVGAWTYETQWWSENNPSSRAYDEVLGQNLCFGQMQIGENFIFCGEMNTLPTAAKPVDDLGAYSRGKWAVFPHSKLQLKSIPSTDPNQQAHQVMTTGAVTRAKVIPRKAGVKSIFHHVIGATIVEFDKDGSIFPRQLNAHYQNGSFYDLDAYVSNGEISTGHRARGINCADIHCAKTNKTNVAATFGIDMDTGETVPGSLVELLKPENIFAHDIHDNESRNHHHEKDNAHRYEMAYRNRESVLEEITRTSTLLGQLKSTGAKIVVVESNHDIALERYVREGRYRMDGINIRLGLQLEDAYLAYREQVGDAIDAGTEAPTFSLLEYAVRLLDKNLKHVEWVHDGQSHVLDGIECGHHGFRGSNGAQGSVAGFAKLGRKMSIGDKHSPEIMDGVYCAGVMALKHGYNKGPSGWATTHIVQYPNGKRTLVTLQNGKYRSDNFRLDVK